MLVSIYSTLRVAEEEREDIFSARKKKKISTVTKAGYSLEDDTSDWCPSVVQNYALKMLYIR